VTVQGDQQAPVEQDLAAAGQLHPGLRDGDPGGQPAGRPEAGPDGEHLPGPGRRQRGDSGRVGVRVAAANGDHPRPRHPRGGDCGQHRSVVVTGMHEQRQAAQGRGCLRRGQHGRVGDHLDARQRSREHIPGHPPPRARRAGPAP
jgi:hypothetical protein